MGGGRVAPNPSTEVDIYDPVSNTWSLGMPFSTARRNFPTDTDGTNNIWLSGGYASDGVTPLSSHGNLPLPGESLWSIADANCDCNSNGRSKRYAYRDGNSNGNSATRYSNANTNPYAKATPTPRPVPTPRVRPTPPPRP